MLRLSLVALTAALLALTACADRSAHPGAAATVDDLAPAGPAPPPSLGPAGTAVAVPPRPAALIVPATDRRAPGAGASAPGVVSDPDGISLNFVDAEIPSVVASVLGATLGLGYAVDPAVQGRITLQTAAPLPRDAVLATLEDVLRLNGVALVRRGAVIQAVPAEAAGLGLAAAEAGRGRGAGWRTQIVPLRHASAAGIQKALEGMAAPGTVVRAEPASNTLIVTGSGGEIASLLDAVALFDVDGMSGQSVGLFRLQRAVPTEVVDELDLLFHANPREALKDVRFIPLERLGAVLTVARQTDTVRRAGEWIARLDRPVDGNDAQLHVYKVESGRAAYLAEVLAKLYPEHAVDRVGRERTQPDDGSAPGGGGGAGNGAGSGAGNDGGLRSAAFAGGAADAFAADAAAAAVPAMGGASATTPPAAGDAAARPDALAGAAAEQRLATGPAERGRASSGVRIVADTASNALLILARPAVFAQIEQTLRKLDVVPAQVQIEATIAEVRLNDQLRFGVQYFIESGNHGVRFSNSLTGAVAPGAPGFSYLFTGGDATVVIDALKAITDVNVLSTPTVMVLDNQTARLQVGEQVPIVTQQSQSVTDSDSPIINQIQLKDTGVILAVTPRITASGIVLIDVWQEVSDVVQTTTSNIDSPTFQRRRVESSVAVGNGETVALGGLVRQNRGRDNSGVPVLSELPVVGALFGVRGDVIDRTELLVLITPRIVRTTRDARAVTDELRRRLSERPFLRPAVLP
ncbi:type II secretion system secretin GspD [Azospirillum sp. ST 5-10]|uniref:type II secretion system secretin GspD n=1 Tax=unclassified Azospirillum TaxID=2630922 RepID=UPI003F4A61DF